MALPSPQHIPVLLDETLAALAPGSGETYLDCTAGLGGHAEAAARCLGSTGNVVLVDLDAGNLDRAAARIRAIPDAPRIETMHGSFAGAPRFLAQHGLRADLVLADLGFASIQVDDPARGLSFMTDGPLDMRLNSASGPTAADLVASLPEGELARIIEEFGEERRARAVAACIVRARVEAPIRTTARLADLIRSVVRRAPGPGGSQGIDPATRTFQALRIAVNDELGNLDALLDAIDRDARRPIKSADSGQGPGTEAPRDAWLAPWARVAIISFHSLEDRPVKRSFAALIRDGRAAALGDDDVTRASEAETRRNPRAGSAKLRAIQLGA